MFRVWCRKCFGTGLNYHSGYFCDHCDGKGYHDLTWPLVMISLLVASVAVVLYGIDSFRSWVGW